jgi:nucleoside 2-deoxyribosyltransferase
MKGSVYLAAPWVFKEQMRAVQDAWEAADFTVTSHWIKYHPPDDIDKDHAALQWEAMEDLTDIRVAGHFVLYPMAKSEGKATEFGYAYAKGLTCVVVGDWNTSNVFFHLPGVKWVQTTEEAIALLSPSPHVV